MRKMRPLEVKIEVLLAFFLLSVFAVPGSTTLHPVDFLVLQSIRKSLADAPPGSAFFATWDFTADPCAFAGVLCSGDRVVALSLGDPRPRSPGLTGSIPPTLGNLSALAELSLVPGRVAGPLPTAFPPDLRFIALAGNLLSGPIPRSLATLRSLRTLDLSSNLLSGAIPPALFHLPKLRTVILAHNRLSGHIPRVSARGSSLVRLDLSNNALIGGVPYLPPSLLHLSLASNQLSGQVDRILPRLTRLNLLDLSMNRLSGPVPGVLFTFPLTSLQLQRNQFSGEVRPTGPLAVAGATVDLSFNRLTGAVPAELAPARRLYLDFNRFTGEVPAAVVARVLAGGMRVLYLHNNFLTGFGVGRGAALPAGTLLCLQYNCMVPPSNTPCPRNAGPIRMRPPEQCAAVRENGRSR